MFSRLVRGFKNSSILLAKKDYYAILGVSQSASESEIKKAYFSLAKQYHPDVNKDPSAKNKFAEISTAYETLGDSEKRKTYDATGMTGDEQDQAKNAGFDASGFSGFNPFGGFSSGAGFGSFQDIFSEFEDFFGQGKKEKVNYKGEDITISLEISFLDAVKGAQKQVNLERKGICTTCKGTKVKPGTSPSKCTNCGGRGTIFFQRGPMSIQTVCTKCKGTGTVIKAYCTPCKGAGYSYSDYMETVNIPAGVNHGQSLRMANKGHQSEGGGPQGDLIIKVNVASHPVFKREGQDIHSDVVLNVPQAALGTVIELETLYGTVKLNVEPGTNSGDQKKIPLHGVPYLPPNQNKKGDHIATFKVKIPKNLTEHQKKLYKELATEEGAGPEESIFTKFKTFYK
jgi:molecular chaperone DnaJ